VTWSQVRRAVTTALVLAAVVVGAVALNRLLSDSSPTLRGTDPAGATTGLPPSATTDSPAAASSVASASTPSTGSTGSSTAAGPTSAPTSASVPPPVRPPVRATTTPPPLLFTPATPAPTLDFVLSTFNVLGASHTSATGKDPGRASGVVRARGAAELIRRHGADVIGFQELQTSQLRALRRLTDLDFYPGSSLKPRDSENSIGWRRDRWRAVEEHVVQIPYFNGGLRAMPVVKLRSITTGLEAWFANFHNPAETAQFHRQQVFRTEATRLEIALANRLITASDLPVFVTGDMNEGAAYFCRLTAGTPMIAARGGSNIGGACRTVHPHVIDWIFGSQGVTFTGYLEDRSDLVDATTDHPVVSARVHIQGTAGG
jgi:hypothetical protein